MSRSSPRESAIVRAIVRAVKARGWWCRKLHGSMYQSGLPDLLVVVGGRAIFLEVKQPGEEPTALQLAEMGELRKAGAVCVVVVTPQDAIAAVERAVFA